MRIHPKIKATLVAYPFVAVVCTWVLIMALVYAFLALQAVLRIERVKKTGVEIIQQISKKAGLPLLEKNIDQLQSVLIEVSLKEGVILACVTDHQNKIVALSGSSQLLPSLRPSDSSVGDADVLQGESYAPSTQFNLVSAINYAGTRIGSAYLTLASEGGDGFRERFMRILALSGVFVLVLTAALYRRQLSAFVFPTAAGGGRTEGTETADATHASIACPLCGSLRPYSRDIFDHKDPAAIPAVTMGGTNRGPGAPTASAAVYLHELGKREDLAWYKRKVTLRCAEIIRILSI